MNKNVFWLGNFRDKNIFYDRKNGQLYSIDKKEEKATNLTWAILPASFLLRNIYFVFDCSLRFSFDNICSKKY